MSGETLTKLDHKAALASYCEGRNIAHYRNLFSDCDIWTRSARDDWGGAAEGKGLHFLVNLQLKQQAYSQHK